MATYGLRIINDDSELLIDSEYFSPAFAQKLELNTTVYSEEAGTGFLHSGYVKREYRTSGVSIPGNYIVMWTLPQNPDPNASNPPKDVWYNFESSTTSYMGVLICYVYANSMGDSLSYNLPTAYLFSIDSLPTSTGPALRLFNNLGVKTFDSNNLQLIPYSISDNFTFWDDPTGTLRLPAQLSLAMPTNPIFMFPNFTSLRVLKQYSGSVQTGHLEFVYEPMFKRQGTTILTQEVQSYYSNEAQAPWPYSQTIYNSGNRNGLGIIVANADFYQSPGSSTGTGTNPTIQLSSNFNSRDEGTTVIVTLNTTSVADGTQYPYTVTGIAVADLTLGGLTGILTVFSNTASASFTFANDLLTEGTETFTLKLDNLTNQVSVTINDTSVPAGYSFGNVTAFNEGTTGSVQFNFNNAANKTISFSVVAPTTGTSGAGAGDTTLITTSYSVGNTNAAGNVSVSYSAAADSITEGSEYFRISATIDGVVYYSDNITISDTSQYPAYGTAIGNPFCIVNTFTLRQVRANGTGGTYSDDTLNSPTCGYQAPYYTLTRSTTSVNEGGSFTITFSTNQSGSFAYTISGVSSADIAETSLTGNVSNGSVLTYNVTADAITEGTETFTITLNNGLASTSVSISDTSQYPAYGTYITQYCSIYTLYYRYANGSGGYFDQVYQTNSATCGYVAPAYSLGNTWSTLANGSSGTFYLYATNANGTSVSVSKSGTGANRVTIDTTNFTISGNVSYTYITVTATLPTTTISSQSVTISLSTGNSFSFTVDAYSVASPLVSFVTYASSQNTYYSGETLTAFINMNGPITPGTYVRVAVWLNGSEAGYNIFTADQSISGVVGNFPSGTYVGYYSVTNPGIGGNVQIKAKAVTSGGIDRQAYINGPTRTLSSAGPP